MKQNLKGNNDADDDEVKEHDVGVEFSDHFESDSDYVYVSSDDGQSSDTLADSYPFEEFQSLPNSDDEGDSNSKIVYPRYNPTTENASTQNVPTPSHVVIFTFYSLVIVKLYYA